MDRKVSKSISTENGALLAEIPGPPAPRPRTTTIPSKSQIALSTSLLESLCKRLSHQKTFRLVWFIAFVSVPFIFLQLSSVVAMTVQNIVVVPNDAPFSPLVATNSSGSLSSSSLNNRSSSIPSVRATPLPTLVPEPESTAEADAARNRQNRTVSRIPVVVWPLWELGLGNSEALHIERNGIDESPVLQFSGDIYNFDPNVVWVGDTGHEYVEWSKWCARFNEHILNATARRIELGLPTSWPIIIVDWTDPGHRIQQCSDVETTVGKKFVSYTKRSIVVDRRWDDGKDWVEEGRITQMATDSGLKYRHTPLMVRTDIIENLQSELSTRGLKLRDKIEELDRPVDVTHLWPLSPFDPNRGKVDYYESRLRTRVSGIVFDMGEKTDLKVLAGTAGNPAEDGRRGVASAYISALLSTKILVVTQRDSWEDHYRLFEALISGALVFTDRMLSLPAGLKNGTSIIEFGSEDQLRSLVEYYLKNTKERLAIARRGRRIAMMRHRTWHRIEEVIFGEARTVCSDSPTGDCPYIVHANETSR